MSDNANDNIKKNNLDNSFDIEEIASMDVDITPDLINDLEQKILNGMTSDDNEDASLFEEPQLAETVDAPPTEEENVVENEAEQIGAIEHSAEDENSSDNQTREKSTINKDIDDNYINKYKAKLKKKPKESDSDEDIDEQSPETELVEEPKEDISALSNGEIIEKEVSPDYTEYAAKLNSIDDDVNYSKYIVYIEPENVEFIESLTVKERKNLFNKILKEQNSIAMTKRKIDFGKIFLKHLVLAIVTILITIPLLYFLINVSLETTIKNYRTSEAQFQTLYKTRGLIKSVR